MKIDVEGHELKVLKGGELFIKQHNPVILFEQNDSDFSNGRSKVVELLKSYGYSFATVEKRFTGSSNKFLKGIKLVLRSFIGEKLTLTFGADVTARFHHLIVAVPSTFFEDN